MKASTISYSAQANKLDNYVPVIVRIHGEKHSEQFFTFLEAAKPQKKWSFLLLIVQFVNLRQNDVVNTHS